MQNLDRNGERVRTLEVVKSRGMSHSNQTREFILTDEGVQFIDIERDELGRVLTGSSRMAHMTTRRRVER